MKRIMWALAILIIPAFVIWGAGTSGKNKTNKPDYAGRVFNKKVSYEDYYNMRNVIRNYAIKSFGNNIPDELLDHMAWTRIILLAQAKRENLRVTDQEVVKNIASFPIFQRNGVFDRRLYNSMVRDTARAFEERLRDDLMITKLREKVIGNISVTDDEVKDEYKRKFETVKASFAIIPFSDFEKDVQYKESDLINFYENNKEAFKKSEQVNVKYIEIPLSIPNAEELGYKVLDEVNLKKNLEEPAKSNSLEIRETSFFSANEEIPGIGWSYEFTKSSFSLNPREINNMLIKLDKGLYIIQLKEKKKPYIPAFSEVSDSVKNAYIKNESVKLSWKKSEKIFNMIKRKEEFKASIKKHGLDIKESDFIMRDGYIPEIGPAKDFVDIAFSLKPGEVSKPFKALQGWVILQPMAFKGIDEAKFSEEKTKFKEELLAAKKEVGFNKYFEELKKKANFASYTLR